MGDYYFHRKDVQSIVNLASVLSLLNEDKSTSSQPSQSSKIKCSFEKYIEHLEKYKEEYVSKQNKNLTFLSRNNTRVQKCRSEFVTIALRDTGRAVGFSTIIADAKRIIEKAITKNTKEFDIWVELSRHNRNYLKKVESWNIDKDRQTGIILAIYSASDYVSQAIRER